MNDAIFSKKPNTLAVSPACASTSCLSLRRDLARTIPARAKGIAKNVRNRLPIPSQKERERNMLISPEKRLKIPLILEFPLILFPPVAASLPAAGIVNPKNPLNNGYPVHVFQQLLFFTHGHFQALFDFDPNLSALNFPVISFQLQ